MLPSHGMMRFLRMRLGVGSMIFGSKDLPSTYLLKRSKEGLVKVYLNKSHLGSVLKETSYCKHHEEQKGKS